MTLTMMMTMMMMMLMMVMTMMLVMLMMVMRVNNHYNDHESTGQIRKNYRSLNISHQFVSIFPEILMICDDGDLEGDDDDNDDNDEVDVHWGGTTHVSVGVPTLSNPSPTKPCGCAVCWCALI